MNPSLTERGRWVLWSGLLCLIVGVLLSDSLILYLGQLEIVLLATSFLLVVPGALALDRRCVKLEWAGPEAAGRPLVMVSGDEVVASLKLVNMGVLPLHALDARPYVADGLSGEPIKPVPLLGAQRALTREFKLAALRAGRWMLHGFDVWVQDPLGMVQTHDYLPCMQAVEVYPRAVRRGRGLPDGVGSPMAAAGAHTSRVPGVGTQLRELRGYEPGDPLRHIAWKASVRRGKLITRSFDQESAQSVYVLLDISSSMRGGRPVGSKFEYALELVVGLFQEVMRRRDAVGLMTFDEKLYGHIPPSSSPAHQARLVRHLVGLQSVLDPELTELDDDELEALLVDYLLIQERLDFRKGDEVEQATGINHKLLARWVHSVYPDTRARWHSDTLREGVVQPQSTRMRRFAQLRGLRIPYRSEARLGMKERGLAEALERLCQAPGRHTVVIVSDLCSIMNLELLTRAIKLAQLRGHTIRCVMPFTPAFFEDAAVQGDKGRVLRELFTSAEREERQRIVQRLRALGVPVELSEPV
jgi:uncharacterized protein (DUF58 family)